MKKLELNFSKRNIAIFGLLVVILLAILFFVRSTYGYYQENLELKNSLEMSVATLSYGLNDEYKVVVPSKGEVRVPIAVMGFNSQETKYQMYYRSSDDLSQVIIGYASYSSNLPSGDLGVGESKQVSLILKNNGNSEVTVFVGVKGGYQNNSIEDILLGNGEIRITNRVESEEVTEDMAAPEDILTGKKAWVNGNQITGTMVNRGTVNQTLKAGESYAIPEGYHDGKGVISSESLASQTQANATASQILSGQTAWVNGSKITGTMANRGNLNWKPSNGTTYTVPAGYYSGGTLDSTSAYNNGYNNGYATGKNDGYNQGYNEGFEAGKQEMTFDNNYHFTNALNDYNMSGWVTMETIDYDGLALMTVSFVSRNAYIDRVDFVQCRIIDKNGNLVKELFNKSGTGNPFSGTYTYTLSVNQGDKIQMYGQNSRKQGYVYYSVDGYVLY